MNDNNNNGHSITEEIGEPNRAEESRESGGKSNTHLSTNNTRVGNRKGVKENGGMTSGWGPGWPIGGAEQGTQQPALTR